FVDIQDVVRKAIKDIGYDRAEYQFDHNSCGVLTSIHEQSADINRGVDRENEDDQGAGDQGMMFGYATDEMYNYMPLPLELAHRLVQELAEIRKEGKEMNYLRPDSKSQVTVEYDDDNRARRIHTIVVSTQHDEWISPGDPGIHNQQAADEAMHSRIYEDVRNILIPRVIKTLQTDAERRLFETNYLLYVNPTGKFVIGGPHGDTGLTGRKIIVDTYGGSSPHGGGAFSGKDSSKVDRSAAYATRHLARNLVAAGIASRITVQVAYAIGMADPVSLNINTHGTAKVTDASGKILSDQAIADRIISQKVYDLRPASIVRRFKLTDPIFKPTASYGHFGRDVKTIETEVFYKGEGVTVRMVEGKERYFKTVELFPWEKDDFVPRFKEIFGI
ncbi:MAG: methionine adenosyltransferase, partial [Bacteroidales bacterium]|nr:methionine adenosyltransferase [Bacteroidales bacterium]